MSLRLSLEGTELLMVPTPLSLFHLLHYPFHLENLSVGGGKPFSDSWYMFPNPWSPPVLFPFPEGPKLLKGKARKRYFFVLLVFPFL
jgi:hypothetical protein